MATDRPGLSDDDIGVRLHWPGAAEGRERPIELDEEPAQPDAAVDADEPASPGAVGDRLTDAVLARLGALEQEVAVAIDELRGDVASLREVVLGWPELEQVGADLAGLRAEVSDLLESRKAFTNGDSPGLASVRTEVEALREEMVSLRRRISLRATAAPVGLDDDQLERLARAISERLAQPETPPPRRGR
jgi:hypothetical protein